MIWCVEDDAAIRDIEIYALESTGFTARGFENGADFWNAIQTDKPELIVLDVMLPEIDGVELLRRLRADTRFTELPIIMATAKGAEYDKIQSLDLGADDYIVKPFGVMELVSRIKAVLRRCKKETPQKLLKTGDLCLNLDERTASIEGIRIQLTYKEYELLKLFMSNVGIAFSREQLFTEVWGANYVGETRTLDMHIRTLRQKLGEYGRQIVTVRNVGYRMEARQ